MGVHDMALKFKALLREWHELEGTPIAWRDRHYWGRALVWATALWIAAHRRRMTALTMALQHGAPLAEIARGLDVPPDARAIRELWEPWALAEVATYGGGQDFLSPERYEAIRDRLIAAERPET
jgi:hypothetical protein